MSVGRRRFGQRSADFGHGFRARISGAGAGWESGVVGWDWNEEGVVCIFDSMGWLKGQGWERLFGWSRLLRRVHQFYILASL